MRTIVSAAALAVACSSPSKVIPASPPAAEPPPAAKARMPDPEPPALRLPGDVKPASYALDLTIVPQDGRARGIVRIELEVVRATRVVWLNAKGLEIGGASLARSGPGRALRVIPGGEDHVGFTLDEELPLGRAQLEVAFGAPIEPAKSVGIYSEKEGDDTYAYTFFEPIDARKAFPCFDEPIYKVPWQLTFHVRRDHVALGNAPVAKETDEPGGMKRVELALSKPLPSYLVAFVVGPFELVDGGAIGRAKTPLRFIIPKGRAGELGWAKQVTPRVVAALEDYFDMDYPYGKLDVAVVPRYWGTMEHPGIVAMGQPLTLIRPEQETRARKQRYANILAHELAHYWFGDYVTMAWWDDTWLNEAFGQWLDMIITDGLEPAWRFRDYRTSYASSAMRADETLSTQPMRVPVETRTAIGSSFDNSITYYKGASVIRMLEAFVGPEKWRDAMRAYMRAHAWRNASAEDLLRVLRDKLGAETEASMRSFVEQPGLPRIRTELRCTAGKGSVAVKQQRALPADVADPAPKLWKLPVCVRSDRGRACLQLDGAEGELALDGCPAWLIPNADATGYYRSVVDPRTAKALFTPGSAIAKAARPTASEKMMMLADLRAMVDRDELAIEKLLELAPLVAGDPDERVASWAFTAAAFRTDVLDDAYYAKAKRFYSKTFGPLARRLGWTRAASDSDERNALRGELLGAVAADDPVLRAQAEVLADRWLAERKGVEDDLVGIALYASAAHGTMARFDKVLAAANAARDRTEKQRLLASLGSFRDPAIARRALDLVLGGGLDFRDARSILGGVAGTRETRDLARAYIAAHLDELLGRMLDGEAGGYLGGLAASPCTPELRAEAMKLVEPRAGAYGGAPLRVKRGLEQSAQCIAKVARTLPSIKRFLDRY